jgi:D-alanyl-lipoteichoic acid acyltransferase DltB (MBOAT superfamily)
MLFNSPIYLFLFLPLTVAIYYLLNRYRLVLAGKAWLVFASLGFYSYWNPIYLPLIVASMLVNYGLGTALSREANAGRRNVSRQLLFGMGVVLNLCLLGYYKYANFFIANLNSLTGADFGLLHLALPLAISFFTFQQVAYLADSFQGRTHEYDFLNYCLFVTFFPQLIAGPIVHHKEMMPQFEQVRAKLLDYRNLALGLFVFFVGLFKKVVIADTFAVWAGIGFDQLAQPGFFDAWTASLSYALQLYFDFSGYTDMAVGSALMFNIILPLNFNSPYKALDIQDFWRRWHMTLSRWLRDYLYIPLGGNRRGEGRTYVNLFLTFLLGGLWHGAGWTFVAWGAMHGAGTALHKGWQGRGVRMPRWFAWFLTFNFVNFAWVFFRATSFDDAMKVFAGMFGLNGFLTAKQLPGNALALSLVFLAVAALAPNSTEFQRRFRPNWKWGIFLAAGIVISLFNLSRVSEFLYFQF